MAKFIKLTKVFNSNEFETMINVDQIICFNEYKLNEPEGTLIYMSGLPETASIYVKESFEYVKKLIVGESA